MSGDHEVEEDSGEGGDAPFPKWVYGTIGIIILILAVIIIADLLRGNKSADAPNSGHELRVEQLEEQIEVAELQKELGQLTGRPVVAPRCGVQMTPSYQPATQPVEKIEVVNLELGVATVVPVKAELGGFTPYVRIPSGMTVDWETVPADALEPARRPYVFPNGTTTGPRGEILRQYGTAQGYPGAAPLTGLRVTLRMARSDE